MLRSARVTDGGIFVRTEQDRAVDILFDGRRIGSFWLQRDTRAAGEERKYPWPDALRRFLDGVTTLSLVDHVSEEELFSAEVHLGTGEERIRIEDAQGNPLGLDKSLRLMRLFESRSAEHVKPLLDSMEAVLAALEKAGVEPFIAYGTLLGAVRDGALIGHDSDADLGYVSAHDHPVDVMLESFHLQRALVEQGFAVTRYSGIAFKVLVEESDGTRRGLDVFGGFLRDGMLYLMGEVGHPFEAEWVRPRSRATLEGRTFPTPAVPEHLLEAMYGPTWRVPDRRTSSRRRSRPCVASTAGSAAPAWARSTSGASSMAPARRRGRRARARSCAGSALASRRCAPPSTSVVATAAT
ncbi:hypothetical protein [Nocardioides ungokensis]|uniref:hypothetical protein n=1 Tax=Nocardioides ungokensis TaxID=1643322 RepID=UPI0015DF68E6|nr:hypothetical protein [Nocardioides ungokensis]